MTEEQSKQRQKLGRGLSALFGEEREHYASANQEPARGNRPVPIELLVPNPFQPRRRFDEDDLRELTESIEVHGLLQPILVRRDPNNPAGFQIVAGERRWRAAQRARLHEVPVLVKDITDSNALEIAIVENVQRQDLDPIEEAEGYRHLTEEFAHRQEDLGKLVGKSRSHIANTLRLLNLPEEVRTMVSDRILTAGHARALLNTADPVKLAKEVVAKRLNVRQTEKLVQGGGEKSAAPARPAKDTDTIALEKNMSELLGLKVAVNARGDGGQLVIQYSNLDQLDDVLKRLSLGELP